MAEGEKLGETIKLKDNDITGWNGHGVQPGMFPVHLHQRPSFAQTEPNQAHLIPSDTGLDNWDVLHPDGSYTPDNLNIDGMELRLHQRPRRFVEGMGSGEKVGETINIKDQDVIDVSGAEGS